MNISLENWIRNKLQENEEMHDYAVATETIRCWIDEYKQLKQSAEIKSDCDCNNYEWCNGPYKLCRDCGKIER